MVLSEKYTLYHKRCDMKKLKEKPVSSVVRRSVALPKTLVREATSVAPPELRGNWNRLVRTALEHYVDELRERQIDEQITEMGKDPHVLADCRRINEEFSRTDADGLRP
jgi:hypothetical protein